MRGSCRASQFPAVSFFFFDFRILHVYRPVAPKFRFPVGFYIFKTHPRSCIGYRVALQMNLSVVSPFKTSFQKKKKKYRLPEIPYGFSWHAREVSVRFRMEFRLSTHNSDANRSPSEVRIHPYFFYLLEHSKMHYVFIYFTILHRIVSRYALNIHFSCLDLYFNGVIL